MSPEERVPFSRGRRHAPHRPGAALSLPLAARRRKAEPPAPRAPEPQPASVAFLHHLLCVYMAFVCVAV